MTLVTGANGFVGRRVVEALARRGGRVRALVRRPDSAPAAARADRTDRAEHVVGDVTDVASLRRACEGVGAVVHLAARAHVLRDESADPMAEYRRVNVEGTRAVMQAAADAHVARVIFVSSVKAVGERSTVPWTEASPTTPDGPYGVSKREAEALALAFGRAHGIAVSVLRLPLVYGPGVRANMLRLFDLVARGAPLPLGGVRNRRSVVYVENVAAAVVALLESPRAAGETFFVSDDEAPSTEELVRRIGRALGRPARIVPGGGVLARLADWAAGESRLAAALPIPRGALQRLYGSLEIDSSKLGRVVGFRPPYSLDEGLRATAEWYRSRRPPSDG